MRVSLIIATLGRTKELGRFLGSLHDQGYDNLEVIVVDQNQDNRLDDVLKPFAVRFSILHLRSEVGLSRARNAALPQIRGDIVAFPDDDCWYPPYLLKQVAGFFNEHREIDSLTGRSLDESSKSGIARFDSKPGRVTVRNVWLRTCSYSIFYRRKVIETVGDFDETLGIGAGTPWEGGEDIDYPVRALKAGFKIQYLPELHIFHPSPKMRDYSQLTERAYKYGAGIGRVWRKHNFPISLVGYYLLRPIGGALISLATGKPAKAKYHWRSFQGRYRGWASKYDFRALSGRC